MRITADMMTRHGYTEGCEGCRHKKSGLQGARGHSERCRKRIMEAISQEEEGFERIRRDQERMDWRQKEKEGIAGVEEKETEEKENEGGMEVDEPEDKEETVRLLRKVIGRLEREQICKMIKRMVEDDEEVDLVEVYSPQRVATEAGKHGSKAGMSMDLINGWDFELESHRKAAVEYIEKVKPKLIIGSPECRMFSALQNLRTWTKDAQKELDGAKQHIRFVMYLYKAQL